MEQPSESPVSSSTRQTVSLVPLAGIEILVAEGEDVALAECYSGLNIGWGKSAVPDSCFTGLIDDVRIYNRAVKP